MATATFFRVPGTDRRITYRTVGHRVILGTEHPIYEQIERLDSHKWICTTSCNGIGDGTSKTFRTLREAKNYFGWESEAS